MGSRIHLSRTQGSIGARTITSNGDLKMDIAKFVLFIVACAFEFGLAVFLFRDQIFGQTDASESEKAVNLT